MRGNKGIIISHCFWREVARFLYRLRGENRKSDKNHIFARSKNRTKFKAKKMAKTQNEKLEKLARELTALAVKLTEVLSREDAETLPLEELAKYGILFEEMKVLMEKRPADAPGAVELAAELRVLAVEHEKLENAVADVLEKSQKTMSLIRDAKSVFQKFVRKPESGEAQFYDKRG